MAIGTLDTNTALTDGTNMFDRRPLAEITNVVHGPVLYLSPRLVE